MAETTPDFSFCNNNCTMLVVNTFDDANDLRINDYNFQLKPDGLGTSNHAHCNGILILTCFAIKMV